MGHVEVEVNKKYCCVTELMDHVVTESRKIYADTTGANTFMIFHDDLSAWREPDAQEYLHTQWGMRDRQIHSFGITNRGRRYYRKLVGNSPELCRGLDAHGFSDLEAAIAYHASLTRLPQST